MANFKLLTITDKLFPDKDRKIYINIDNVLTIEDIDNHRYLFCIDGTTFIVREPLKKII